MTGMGNRHNVWDAELRSAMFSARTAKYVEAMISEGDDFDFRSWLRRVREEETKAKQVPAAFSFGESPPSEIVNLTNTPDRHEASIKAEPAPKTNSSPIPRVRRQLGREAISRPPEIGLRLRLVMVCNAWDDFQESRKRDAVYGYLKAVFALVVDCKGRRRTKRLLRRAFQFAGLPLDKNADPFTVVIRCTSERNVDNKTISKWARALRYSAHCKRPRTPLKTFIKKMGGINACADRYAIYLGRKVR
jgi:hypothetical protein